MKLVCLDNIPEFTIGKHYTFEWDNSRNTKFNEWWINIENDKGEIINQRLNEYIIQFLPPSEIWVEYIGFDKSDLTYGKYYNLLQRGNISLSDEHYYFLDDSNKFVGIYNDRRKFRDVSKLKMRIDKFKELGI